MSITSSINLQNKRILTHIVGDLSVDQLKKHFETQIRDGIESYSELIDMTDAATVFTGDEIRKLSKSIRRLSKNHHFGTRAFVAPDEARFGMFRMLSLITEDCCSIEVFRNREAAENWLS